MNTLALRRAADLERLRALAEHSAGRIELLDAPSVAGRPIRLRLRVRTAASERFPADAIDQLTMRIDTPARYPFERPVVTVEPAVFHPNVFANGVICQGEKWSPSEGMDLFVTRVAKLLSFDPAFVNPHSAANRAAAAWYIEKRKRSPASFPSDRFDTPGAAAAPGRRAGPAAGAAADEVTPEQASADRVVRRCPNCAKGLRLPGGRSGTVACPACRHEFAVQT